MRKLRRVPLSSRRDLDELLDALAGRRHGLGGAWLYSGPSALLGRDRPRQRGRVLGGHEREVRAVRIVARRARAARALAEPEARGEAVDAGLPVAQLVAVAGAAQLVGLVERDQRPVGQVEPVDVVFRMAAVAPAAERPVVEDLLRVKLGELALVRVGRAVRGGSASRGTWAGWAGAPRPTRCRTGPALDAVVWSRCGSSPIPHATRPRAQSKRRALAIHQRLSNAHAPGRAAQRARPRESFAPCGVGARRVIHVLHVCAGVVEQLMAGRLGVVKVLTHAGEFSVNVAIGHSSR